jgi:DNA-binding NarL/FixJ family response regulator
MKYSDINYSFFNTIDTQEKAYCLGFLYADGCVSHNLLTLSLKLHQQDEAILTQIKNLISPSSPLKIIDNKYLAFRIHRKQICQQLLQLGCTPQKSLTLTFPTSEQVPSHLIQHFIRGYSDGDGCINFRQLKTGRKDFAWSIVSTNDFCQSLKDILKQKLNVNCHIKNCDPTNKNTITKTLIVGGSLQLIKVLNWMYQDSAIHMDRKYKKYLQFQDQINSNSLQSKFSARGCFNLDQNVIISLYKDGNNKRKIAKLMKCDVKSVYQILKNNGIATIKSNSIIRENTISSKSAQIIELYNNGVSVKDIAAKFNCTTNNITIILKKNKIQLRKILSSQEIDKVLQLRNNGLGCVKIAQELNCSKSTIVRLLRKHKC